MKTIRLAILSDIHAFTSGTGSAPSWMDLALDQSNPNLNPFAGLYNLIRSDDRLHAEIVVCCGDMGDKASPEGQQYVWAEISKLQHKLGASQTIATAGNHDMDSRFQNTDHDAKGQLQSLEPLFPISTEQNWLEYWAKNYTIFKISEARFVLLNSAAYHGYQKDGEDPEYLHGRVSDRTLDALIAELKTGGKDAANILVCHHHPIKNDQIKIEEYSEMKSGDRLINELVNARLGPWLIIHGHKHLPRISYASGSSGAPTIFSAGSFSAKLPAEYATKAQNEFYILELEIPPSDNKSSTLKGTIFTWNWNYGTGWQRSSSSAGLGVGAAFGAKMDVAAKAQDLATQLKSTSPGLSVLWDDICSNNLELKYLIPEDKDEFLHHLKEDHNIISLRGEDGDVKELQVPDGEG